MPNTFVYVHGTNGSGKSTLARTVLSFAGGAKKVATVPGTPKAPYTIAADYKTFLVGKYLTSCGGVDGVQPYANVKLILKELADYPFNDAHVLAEGLVTPGVATCVDFASMFDETLFILLDTPEDQCVANVLKRRDAAGNRKPYDPANLYVKARSARSWAGNLERAGLQVRRLQYPDALRQTLSALRLDY